MQPYARVLAHIQAAIPILIIEWMIVIVAQQDGDMESPYYAGLSLVLVGSVLMHRWSVADGIFNAIFVVGSYLALALAIDTPADALTRNTFFLFITACISCIGLHYYKLLLFDDYCLRSKLGVANDELAAALKELGENEARLLHVEKLSSLGRMSAGIVHEINNPLNYTKTALHAVKMFADDLPETEKTDFLDMLRDADEGVERVIKIVSDLRAFTKGRAHTMDISEISLAKVIEATRRLVSQEIREIEFQVEVDEAIQLLGNENQLVQVFVNLLQNASQAMLETTTHGKNPKIRISASPTIDRKIIIRVRDNGCGIPEKDLENVFDPFFTKRDIGDGMGLGLSICHRIIEAHNATIEVESKEGEYTEFVLTFPTPESKTSQSTPS